MVSILFAMEVKGISSIKATKASLLLSLTSLSDIVTTGVAGGWGTEGGQIITFSHDGICGRKLADIVLIDALSAVFRSLLCLLLRFHKTEELIGTLLCKLVYMYHMIWTTLCVHSLCYCT